MNLNSKTNRFLIFVNNSLYSRTEAGLVPSKKKIILILTIMAMPMTFFFQRLPNYSVCAGVRAVLGHSQQISSRQLTSQSRQVATLYVEAEYHCCGSERKEFGSGFGRIIFLLYSGTYCNSKAQIFFKTLFCSQC